ncbi:MAG: transcription-repair coupling factor, partial [Armatimonadota bacterium]
QELSPVPPPTTYVEWDDAVRAVKSTRRVYLHAVPRSIPWETNVRPLDVECKAVKRYFGQMSELASDMRSHLAEGEQIVLFTDRQRRVLDLLAEHKIPAEPGEFSSPSVAQAGSFDVQLGIVGLSKLLVVRGRLSEGFAVPMLKLRVLTDVEMFGERRVVRPRRTFRLGAPILATSELKEGDYVVHINHGIGIYRGLVRLTEGQTERDFLRIDYAGGDKIYVPTDQLDRVQKYIGSGEHPPEIHRLGSGAWGKTTARVRAKVREMARELLQLYAARAASQGYAYGPDTIWQQEMEDAFPYTETPDQARAIEEVKRDLESPVPMDRLICGDVGFGKTEVAIRAAFKVAVEGKQVAVLVPTTVLAEQHFETFQERMKGFPLRIEMLSRFKTPVERKRILEGLKDGSVDIVIGTHMLLSKNVQFHDLGLLVIDEEHRFGVAHKERLKQLKTNVDVITLTATPIPRTLHMALSGIRDMSIINNPPEGRMAIKTYLSEYSDSLVRSAILRELDRGGQVFVVYNRVEKIDLAASRIQRLVPQAKVGVAHGQMPERQLEQVMWEFYHRKFNVLVCSTIIESGLDIPNANTIIIFDADKLGLAQLYQLRGRVGRSNRQAYCYLLYRKNKILSESAQKRLQTIREFTELGSGFQIAMKDLEIRGAGNLLGPEQSGFLESVGFELYCQMIADAVRELKGEKEEVVELPPVDVHVDAYIPADYIPSEGLRIAFYRRLASVRTSEDLQRIQEELEDRFGDPPPPVWNIIQLIHMRLLAHACGIAGVSADSRRAVFRLSQRLTRPDINILSLRHKHWYPQIDRVEVEISGKSDVLQAVNQNLRILAGYLKPGVDKQIPHPKRRRSRETALTAR